MKTLDEIKQEVNKNPNYTAYLSNFDEKSIQFINQIAKLYAEEVIKECAVRARTKEVANFNSNTKETIVDSQSILSLLYELK